MFQDNILLSYGMSLEKIVITSLIDINKEITK